jgi:hypothetical protein
VTPKPLNVTAHCGPSGQSEGAGAGHPQGGSQTPESSPSIRCLQTRAFSAYPPNPAIEEPAPKLTRSGPAPRPQTPLPHRSVILNTARLGPRRAHFARWGKRSEGPAAAPAFAFALPILERARFGVPGHRGAGAAFRVGARVGVACQTSPNIFRRSTHAPKPRPSPRPLPIAANPSVFETTHHGQ